MHRFTARNVSEAILPVERDRIWSVVSDPACLAELTPLVRSITPLGENWCWELIGFSALGVSVEPAFTERMDFTAPERIEFRPDPPAGAKERFGATGTYVLEPEGVGATRLSIEIELHAELPLPRLSARAVERVMSEVMEKTGERFAANLYDHLGIDPADVVLDPAPKVRA